MNKVVYNGDYGGFGLSPKAIKRYYELRWPEKKVYFYTISDYGGRQTTYHKVVDLWMAEEARRDIITLSEDFGEEFKVNPADREDPLYEKFHEAYIYLEGRLVRHDPILVQVVEELDEEASGYCAHLKVAEIQGNRYRIDEYDGWESIIEDYDDWIVIE